MSSLISVVMPVRNGAAYLRESIGSICRQTWRDLELIVVDDDSTDDTPKILQQLTDRRIVVERNANNLGPALSRNHGMSMAQGEYIACMDADDVALPGRLEMQIEFLRRNPDIALVGSAATTIDAEGRSVDTHYPQTDPQLIKEKLVDSNCFVQSSVMMRTSAARAAGGYRFPLAEDYDLWLRMSEQYQLANLPVPLVLYRTHHTQTSIQQIEKLAMWTLAAKHAARVRRSGLPDPMTGVEELSAEFLVSVGIDQKEIHDALVESILLRLNLLVLMGCEAEGVRQTKQLMSSEVVNKELRSDIAARILDLARDYYAQQRYATSRALLNLSVKLDPQLMSTAKTIELALKSALGKRGTRILRNIKRAVAPPQSSAV